MYNNEQDINIERRGLPPNNCIALCNDRQHDQYTMCRRILHEPKFHNIMNHQKVINHNTTTYSSAGHKTETEPEKLELCHTSMPSTFSLQTKSLFPPPSIFVIIPFPESSTLST